MLGATMLEEFALGAADELVRAGQRAAHDEHGRTQA
jgi:hypothetical protein